MRTDQRIRRWVAGNAERIGWVHSQSRQHAYAALVPPDALARLTPEHQAGVWRVRMVGLPDQHVGIVAEQEGEVVGFALGQLTPVQVQSLPRFTSSRSGRAPEPARR